MVWFACWTHMPSMYLGKSCLAFVWPHFVWPHFVWGDARHDNVVDGDDDDDAAAASRFSFLF